MNLHWLCIFSLPCWLVHGFMTPSKTYINILKNQCKQDTNRCLHYVPDIPTIFYRPTVVRRFVSFTTYSINPKQKLPDKPNKIQEWFRLSRLPKNIVSSSLLTFVGAYITHPDTWQIWVTSPPFWAAYGMVQCITASSMIINDMYDLELDRHQHPDRPLVLGTITMNEARISVCTLLSITFVLGLQYLPPLMDPLWMTNIGLIVLYTPFFKKITLVKNVVCATVVASTIPFMAIATINPIDFVSLYEQHWTSMWITTQITFMASMYIEMLLDVLDEKGDRESHIQTIPVRYGPIFTMQLLRIFLLCSYISIFTQTAMVGNYTDFFYANTSYFLFYYGWNMVNKDTNRENVVKAIQMTTFALVFFLGQNIF